MTNHHTSEIAPAEAAAQVDVAEAPLRSTSPAWVPTLTGGPARTVGAATRQSCVPSFDLPSMTAERLAAFSPFYIEALVVQWPDAGPPVALTGTEAADLPALTSVDGSPRLADSAARASGDSVWILSAADPDGLEFGIEENIARHADLVALVDQEAEGPAASAGGTGAARELGDPDRPRWWPAVGAALDGSHHELSLAVTGITAERARAIGLRFGQLAIFEMTHDVLRLTPCVEAGHTIERPRRLAHTTDPTISRHQLTLWHSQHERAADRATNHFRRHWG